MQTGMVAQDSYMVARPPLGGMNEVVPTRYIAIGNSHFQSSAATLPPPTGRPVGRAAEPRLERSTIALDTSRSNRPGAYGLVSEFDGPRAKRGPGPVLGGAPNMAHIMYFTEQPMSTYPSEEAK